MGAGQRESGEIVRDLITQDLLCEHHSRHSSSIPDCSRHLIEVSTRTLHTASGLAN